MSDSSHHGSDSNGNSDLPPLHPQVQSQSQAPSQPSRSPSIAVDVDAECHGPDLSDDGASASGVDDCAPLSLPSSLSSTLPSANFHRWMNCLACVTFDLTLGPSLEAVYPHNQLTADEITNGADARRGTGEAEAGASERASSPRGQADADT